MTRSLYSNLLKRFSIGASAEDEKRVIDSDILVKRRLEKLAEEAARREGGGDGFVSGLVPVEVLEAPEDGGNLIKAQDEAKEILAQARAEADSVLAGISGTGPYVGGFLSTTGGCPGTQICGYYYRYL